MLRRILLCHKINKFYANMYDGYYVKWQVKDTKNIDCLFEVLFDINEVIENCDGKFLINLKKQIERLAY